MARRLFLCVLLASLAGCASQPKKSDLFVAEVAALLPGSYDNLAQARAGHGHAALRLVIAPVQAALVGERVYYVQEMAADDPRRVLAQRLYVLAGVEGAERAVLLQADFAEPSRWRDGHLNRDLFKSLLPEDVRPRAGCDLVFSREPDGLVASGRDSCRVSAPGTGEALKVEQRIELDADGIAIREVQRDAAGVPVGGSAGDSWYRFARRADAPW